MTIGEMKKRKEETGLTYEMLSRLSGVPVPTLQKIFHGKTKSPRYQTMRAIEQALRIAEGNEDLHRSAPRTHRPYTGMGRETDYSYGTSAYKKTDHPDLDPQDQSGSVNSPLPMTGSDAPGMPKYIIDKDGNYIWTMQGSYTVDDYLALPDEKRVELIDGVIYEMNAPRYLHQRIAGEVYRQIANFILDRGGECEVFIAPADVQLDNDNFTMVQPDVFILCDKDKSDSLRMYGAPDFVLEVISPSTKKKDFTIKLAKYMNAGVREYWIMDPYREIVMIYFFEEDDMPQICGYDEPIPVRIYGGRLKIDPKHISRWILEEKSREEK